jgi:hypothetical protein
LRKYAERWARSYEPEAKEIARAGRLVPKSVGWYVLGLANEAERPGLTLHIPVSEQGVSGTPTVTPDIVRSTQLTYRRAEATLQGGQADENQTSLEGLRRVSGWLAAARGGQESVTPRDIIRETTAAAEQALAAYMQANGIPGLYREPVHPDALAGERWSPHPQDFAAGKAHAAWAGSLHELASFINHSNVAAFERGEALPYTQNRLEKMVWQYNRNIFEGNVSAVTGKLQEQYEGEWRNARFSAVELRDFITRSSVDPLDLAIAMFAASGQMNEIRQTQEVAARYIAASPHLARAVLGAALAHNALVITDVQPDAPQELTLSDGASETYPYGPEKTFGVTEADVAFIGRVAGIDNLRPGTKQPSATTNKTARTRPAASKTAKRAKRPSDTGRTPLDQNAKKMSPKPPKLPASGEERRAIAHANPRSALAARMTTAGCKPPAFSFDVPGECTATVTDPDGTSYTVTIAGDKSIPSRNRAAAALLAKLPPRPLNKRGDMWQGPTGAASETD